MVRLGAGAVGVSPRSTILSASQQAGAAREGILFPEGKYLPYKAVALLGCDRATVIAAGAESWAAYANKQDNAHIEFSLRQVISYCLNLDRQLPDLSDEARLHAPVSDVWKEH